MVNELLKAQYRLDFIQKDAIVYYHTIRSLLSAEMALADEQSFIVGSENIARLLAERLMPELVVVGINAVKDTQKDKFDEHGAKQPIESFVLGLSEKFIEEIRWAGFICCGDVRLWAAKAQLMGTDQPQILSTIAAAWATGTPRIYSDFDKRVKDAIHGWTNNVMQGSVMLGMGFTNGEKK